MSTYDFDLFTIGAGSGGVAASRRAAAYGARVAICESTRVGGTCVLRGCVPKKLLWYASHFHQELEDAAGYGWSTGKATLDWGKLNDAKNAELDRLNGIYLGMLDRAGVTLHTGRGRIVDAHTVEVAGKQYTTERILVATGGWPHVPKDIPGAELGITSNEALDLATLPKRIAIVGGGYIAVEFAGIFAGAGVEVTMLVRGYGVLRHFDVDVGSALTEELKGHGIAIKTHTRIEAIENNDGALRVRCNGDIDHDVDTVMWATGRWPNTRNIGLEDVGVAQDDHGAISVDEWSRTNIESVYAIGDCTTRAQLTPVAIADGRALVQTLYNNNPTKIDHQGIATAVFSQPPVGTVGLTESEARATIKGHVDVYRTDFRPMKHVLPGRSERVLMKLIVERETDLVVGAHMVGGDAPEIIQGIAIAMKAGATKKQFDATVGIHPTSAEEFTTMFEPLDD
ncbi:MAG: glutathione-disulfide reductase [Nannocystaceae bacterium]|nr:glutathione-disulfide reductase [Nannocystaceae bacterium]